jgi:hypothetical protein
MRGRERERRCCTGGEIKESWDSGSDEENDDWEEVGVRRYW